MVIIGTGFQPGATVTFGGVHATSVVVVTETQITGLTPVHAAGLVNVTVTNPDGGSATLTNGFRYVPPVWADTPLSQLHSPTLPTDTRPNTHLVTDAGTPGTPVPPTADPANPPRLIDTPLAPFPLFMNPFEGPTGGFQTSILTGFNFINGASVDFLTYNTANPPSLIATQGCNASVINANNIQCLTPFHAAAGLVDVRVTNPDGQTGTLPNGYLYSLGPSALTPGGDDVTLSSASPIQGTTAGGDTLIIHGANMNPGCQVLMGGTVATVVSQDANSITVTTPRHTPGIITIEVVNP